MLVLARLAVRFVPLAHIFAWASHPPRHLYRFAGEEACWIAWAVEELGARRRMNVLSLPRALATHAMLRRRGIASRLCLGVAHDGVGVATRAWVEVGKDKIVGNVETGGFTRLAEFGGASR